LIRLEFEAERIKKRKESYLKDIERNNKEMENELKNKNSIIFSTIVDYKN